MNPISYDIIGDIHGCADSLNALLCKLNYHTDINGIHTARKPDGTRDTQRIALFLGDLIDRGPHQKKVLDIVRGMIKAGSGKSVMANHEYNAIAFSTPSKDDSGYLRAHLKKNIRQHLAFLNTFADFDFAEEQLNKDTWSDDFEEWYNRLRNNPDYLDTIEWFKELPLWIEENGIRVIHACWDQKYIDKLGKSDFDDELLHLSSKKDSTWQYDAIESLIKGPEIDLPGDISFTDPQGIERTKMRVKWWDQLAETYREAFSGPGEQLEFIPDIKIATADFIKYPDHLPPVFIGHYWLDDHLPSPLASNIACTDYSIAKENGKLVAYRWSGEPQLLPNHFVWVDKQE